MNAPVIELRNVFKRFGKRDVLHGVDLTVEPGKTYAFLGRNGAGKTTTIRLLMGLLKPDSGSVRVLGLDPATDALAIRRQVGYLAEDQQMWGWMKIKEILRFIAAFYPTWDWPYAKKLVDQFQLSPDTKIKHLSKGQNVRLGLLLALAHRPRLMILDDPALGLDPIMRKDFLRDVVEHLQGEGITVFFSSHLLYEIEPVADTIGILHDGLLVREADTETLRATVKRMMFSPEAWAATERQVGAHARILDLRPDNRQIAVTLDGIDEALKVAPGVEVTDLNLDEIFEAYVVGKHTQAPATQTTREPVA
jgi:ABC-2 type transport system ATP-binding protein